MLNRSTFLEVSKY